MKADTQLPPRASLLEEGGGLEWEWLSGVLGGGWGKGHQAPHPALLGWPMSLGASVLGELPRPALALVLLPESHPSPL